jgi:serine phosphatase RsbU (regulator of sigma subunit)
VLLSCPSDSPHDELRQILAAAGFSIVDHLLGSAPAVDLAGVAVAVIEVGAKVDVAAAQTRRWKVEWGDQFVPILWVVTPAEAVVGFEAGAEAVTTQPLQKEAFIAQIHALARVQTLTARLALRTHETRLLGDQLGKVLAQLEREHALVRHIHALLLPSAFAEVGAARFRVGGRPAPAAGSDFYNVFRLDEEHVAFLVGDVVSSPVVSRCGVSVLVQQTVRSQMLAGGGSPIISPADILTVVNQQLLAVGGDDPPLVAMLVGVLNTHCGELTLARAGLPPPVFVPRQGPMELWHSPGPFLGTAAIACESLTKTLRPGDRLLIGTHGTRPDGDPRPVTDEPLGQAASRHRDAHGAEFVDALVRELRPTLRHTDDMTILMVEIVA